LQALAEERTERNVWSDPNRTEKDIPRTETPAAVDPSAPASKSTVLEQGLQQVEESYKAQMMSLISQLDAATDPDQQDMLQQQVQQLKVDWTLALAHRQLELARERQDTRAEGELLEAIARIQDPTSSPSHAASVAEAAKRQSEGGAK
jgi:hypothetical protein